ncbi:MAG: T9SS type A sorting domain-containing protein [Bacteroidetes bacterium]|nr:T9SS type A sorting domain-containing protein [Bacteroidota bacterium]
MRKLLLLLFALSMSMYSIGQSTTRFVQVIPDFGTNPGPSLMAPSGQNQILPVYQPNSMTQWILPFNGGTSGNTRAPGNTYRYQRTEYLITAAEMAAAGFLNGNTINGIGFNNYAAGTTSQVGNFIVYLRNTTDASYTLGSTWTTAGFTTASNIASWSVPVTAGNYYVPFSGGSLFTYTGSGLYVAWEYNNPANTLGTGAVTVSCDYIAGSAMLYGYRSTTAQGTALAVSDYRPATAFITNTWNDVIAVTNVYALERMPVPFSTPNSVAALVSNVSASAQSFNLTLTIKDVATSTTRYTATMPVTALAAGASATVTFTGIPLTLEENVNITVATSVIAGENWTVNNTLTIPGEVNCNTYSYNYTATNAPVGYGFAASGAGLFLAKYSMNGTGQIKGANISMATYSTNAGNIIYAVLLNSSGAIMAQSANYTLTSADQGTNKYFAFPTPQTITNDVFYIGLAQTANATAYYPLGIFPESPPRGNTFYTAALTGGTPSADPAAYKYGVEAVILRPPTVVTIAATGISSSGGTLNATISANRSTTTTVFQYSTDLSFSNSIAVPGSQTGQLASVSATLTGLQPYTLYNYRAVSINADGTTTGNTMSFTTSAIAPLTVTQDPTMVGATFATLNGTATAYNASTVVTFEYGTTTQYLGGSVAAMPSPITGNSATNFSASLSGLTINTTYHYRAKGVNVAGTTYGLDKTFFTTCVIPPVPGAITGPSGVCKTGTAYTYSVSQVPYGFVYNWTFPTGFTITSYPHSNSVTVDVSNTAVSGTISVIAVSDCGAPSTASTKAVTVNDLPVPTVSGNTPVCQYVGTNYTTQPSQSAYVWSALPDGTVTPTANPEVVSINWATPGSKTVQVIYTNPATGCTAAAPGGTKAVSVTTAPVPTITGTNNMCMNSGFYDYLTEPGKTGYTWNVSPGGSITAGQGTYDCQVVWNAPGPQWVSVNYNGTGGCAAQTATVFNVSVNGMPGNAGSISGPSTVCFGSTGNVYSVGAISNTVYYVWTLPAGANIVSGAGTNTITVNYSPTAVSGNITVYGNSLCGNGSTSPAFPVTVNYLPAAAGDITGVATVCAGEQGVAYSVSPISGATGYTWALPLGAIIASGANTPNITVNFATDATSGNVSVLGTNACGNGPLSHLPVTVTPLPSAPEITVNGDTLTSSAPTGNQWFYDGSPIVTGTGQVLIAHFTGWYWDDVILNGCPSDTSNHIFIVVSGISEPAGSSFVVSPVPNDGQFKLMMNTPTTATFDVTISNIIGAKVYEKTNVMVNGPTNLLIDLRPISAGVYTMVIRNNESKVIRKIVINK